MLKGFTSKLINESDGKLVELETVRHGLKYTYQYLDRGPGPLVVTFPAVRRPDDKSVKRYQRTSWAREIPASFLFLPDPYWQQGVRTSGLQGGPDFFLPEEMAADIHELAQLRDHPLDRTLFYGSSVGGLPAIQAGTFLKGVTVFAECPQLFYRRLEKDGPRARVEVSATMARLCYGVDCVADIPAEFDHRLSAVDAFRARGLPDRLKIFVRKSDTYVLEKHVLPVTEMYPQIELALMDDRTGTGHSPLALDDVRADLLTALKLPA